MTESALIHCADSATFASSVAAAAMAVLEPAIEARGAAALAVPGGTTPREYLPAISALPLAWERATVTLTDERWVAVTSPQSNERLARRLLLRGPAAAACFVGLKTPQRTPAAALDTVDARLAAVPWPLDLALLGVGDDGHIASLFPGAPAEADGFVVAATAPVPPRPRISLKLSLLAAARRVVVVAAGARKRVVLERALSGAGGELPIARLCAAAGTRLRVFVRD